MRIIQLSDSHLSGNKPQRTAELESCIAYINALEAQPDVVVHTGDIAHDGLLEEYRTAKHLLDRLSAPYFVLPGNRDRRENLISVFADDRHIRPGMGFVQYAVEDFPARLIMIDTMSADSNKGDFCAKRFADMRHLLTFDTSKPAVLFCHHPPFEVPVGPEPRNFKDWSEAEAFIAEIKRHDHLRGLYCGHVHRSFETSIGSVPAGVVSSVVSDLRWDRPAEAESGLPVFRTRSVT